MVPHAEGFPLLILCCILAHIVTMPPEGEGVSGRVD